MAEEIARGGVAKMNPEIRVEDVFIILDRLYDDHRDTVRYFNERKMLELACMFAEAADAIYEAKQEITDFVEGKDDS